MLERQLDPFNNPEDLDIIAGYMEQFEKDSDFLNAHRLAWTEQYPDKWVVVFGEELVGLGETAEEALQAAEEKGAPKSRVAMEYLYGEPITMILAGVEC